MPYILLNYYANETRKEACRPEMHSKTAEEMHKEIRDFVESGHVPFIQSKIEDIYYHSSIKAIAAWMANPEQPLHVVTETYKQDWDPLIFDLIFETNPDPEEPETNDSVGEAVDDSHGVSELPDFGEIL